MRRLLAAARIAVGQSRVIALEAAAIVLMTGCGPPPAADDATEWEEPPVHTAPPVRLEAADLPPAPSTDAAWLRIRTPNRDLPAVVSLGVIPPRARPLLLSPRFALDRMVGTPIANAADMGAPIDLLASPEKGGHWISISLTVKRGLDLAAFASLVSRPIAPGRYRLRAQVDDHPAPLTCELVLAKHVPNPHVVCSSLADRLDWDTAFLVGTAARSTATDQFRAELPLKSFQEGVTRRNERDFGARSWSGDLVMLLMAEFFAEQRAIGAAASISDRGIDVSFDLALASAQSFYSSWFAGHAWSAGPPASFWQLPADADVAVCKSGPESKADGTGFERVLTKLAAAPPLQAMSDTKRRTFIDIVRALSPFDTDVAVAFGQDRAAVARALDATQGSDAPPAALDELKLALRGWLLVAIGRDPATFLESFQNMLRVDANARTAGRRSSLDLERSASLPRELPAGSLHYVARRGDPAGWFYGRREEERLHLFLVPDRGTVWLSLSADENVAARRVVAALRSDPTSRSSRPELAEIPTQNLSGIGLFSIAGAVSLGLEAGTPTERAVARHRLSLLGALPDGGTRRIPCWAETVTGPSGVSVRFTARFSREAFAALLPFAGDWDGEARGTGF